MVLSTTDNIPSSRLENSLHILTKKFIKFISDSLPKATDTRAAAECLGVSKRRIYDITNALEGIGYIKKHSVNMVSWIGGDIKNYIDDDSDKEKLSCTSLEENMIDEEIEKLNQEIEDISSNEIYLKNGYVTYKNILDSDLLKEKLIFAVKAPADIVLESKLDGNLPSLELSTQEGRIEVFFVSDDNLPS
ncbi:Transcription factor E2F [Spraguea lophii 42_110]|uniref:Transcription factor E2F n=1 Tax=Spraguea lophii (strain 42_110) TaxID=1358809 RepID=S7W6Z2_SPRLO|nr:Transcription factor E2F [Spraguea lophii 42_110]